MKPEQWMKRLINTLVPESLLIAVIVCAPVPLSAQVKFDMQGDHVAVLVGGKPFTDFYTGAAYPKPFLWPLRSAEGVSVTRNFPMRIVPGESTDHPHHRGLFIGYGEINGLNFWENEDSYKSSNRGRIVIRRIGGLKGGKKSGTLNTLFEWHDAAGADIMDENRTMVFYDEPDRRTIDFDITFTAKIALNWADTKEGFFAIRLADSMAEKNGGLMVNSEGARGEKAVWGHQAFWVDYSGKVEGQQLGISILAHPSNPRFPPRWHSRAYGLFAVNPWGLKQFIGDEQAKGGGLKMQPGESITLRYRVIIHGSNIVPLNVPDLFREYISKVK